MCDLTPLIATLSTVAALITAAAALIAVAAALNAGFFSAGGAVAPMVAAAIASGSAAALLSFLGQVVLDEYYQCMGRPAECRDLFRLLIGTFNVISVTLWVQTAATAIAAGVSWIPWAPQAAMWTIFATLLVQLAMIPATTVLVVDFINCVEAAAVARTVGPLLTVTGVLITLVLVGVWTVRNRTMSNTPVLTHNE